VKLNYSYSTHTLSRDNAKNATANKGTAARIAELQRNRVNTITYHTIRLYVNIYKYIDIVGDLKCILYVWCCCCVFVYQAAAAADQAVRDIKAMIAEAEYIK
jgi:hypothetical protein